MTTRIERLIRRGTEKLLEGNHGFQMTSMCVELMSMKRRIDKYTKKHFPIGKNITIRLASTCEFPGVIACYYADHEWGLIAEVGPEVVDSLPVAYQMSMNFKRVRKGENQYTIDWMQVK